MKNPELGGGFPGMAASRRTFISRAGAGGFIIPLALQWGENAQAVEDAGSKLAFVAEGHEFRFDTGQLRGTLRAGGKSQGLLPATETTTHAEIASSAGLCSHYRLLDDQARYGKAGWEWTSQARLLPDGAVEASWNADAEHPFDMKAVYRWKAADTLDVTTTMNFKKPLHNFEVFLASYFAGFTTAFAYVKEHPERGGKAGFLTAKESFGKWQMFPRDKSLGALINDGRWDRLPHPVAWTLMPEFSLPLAMRRHPTNGLTALVMAPPEDCFALATPYNEEKHFSLYLSLFGRDFAAGQNATARARMVISKNLSDEKAVELAKAYLKEIR